MSWEGAVAVERAAPDYAGHSAAQAGEWERKRGAVWADIIARHEAGEPHPSIAASYGISRERVRQIVKKLGGTPRRQTYKEGIETAMREMDASLATIEELADRTRISAGALRSAARERGIRPITDAKKQRFLAKKRAAGFVLMGESYRRAARRAGISCATVEAYCKSIGVRSKHPCRAAIARATGAV